jgi:hypothetical protein
MISTGTSLFYHPYFCVYNYLEYVAMLSICWTTKPIHNFKSKCINEIPLFIIIFYQQIKEMIYTRVQMKTLHRESTYKDFIQKNESSYLM